MEQTARGIVAPARGAAASTPESEQRRATVSVIAMPGVNRNLLALGATSASIIAREGGRVKRQWRQCPAYPLARRPPVTQSWGTGEQP